MRSGHSGPTNAKQEIFSKLQYLNELVQSYECLSTISPDSEYYDGINSLYYINFSTFRVVFKFLFFILSINCFLIFLYLSFKELNFR